MEEEAKRVEKERWEKEGIDESCYKINFKTIDKEIEQQRIERDRMKEEEKKKEESVDVVEEMKSFKVAVSRDPPIDYTAIERSEARRKTLVKDREKRIAKEIKWRDEELSWCLDEDRCTLLRKEIAELIRDGKVSVVRVEDVPSVKINIVKRIR